MDDINKEMRSKSLANISDDTFCHSINWHGFFSYPCGNDFGKIYE